MSTPAPEKKDVAKPPFAGSAPVGAVREPPLLSRKGGVWRFGNALPLLLILLLAAGLRFHNLGAKSFWLDEATSVWATGPGLVAAEDWQEAGLGGRIAAMVRRNLRHDAHPPLFQILLLLSLESGGRSEAAARFPSAVAGLLTVALLYHLGRTMYDRKTGLTAALLGAVSAHLVFFSQEARLYSLLALVSVAHACLLVDWIRHVRIAEDVGEGRSASGKAGGRRGVWAVLRWAGYVAVGAAGLWTFALYGAVLVGHWLHWGLYAPRNRRSAFAFAAAQALIVSSFLPWVPHLQERTETLRRSLLFRPQDERPLSASVAAPALLDAPAGTHLALENVTPALAPSAENDGPVFAHPKAGEGRNRRLAHPETGEAWRRWLALAVWSCAAAALARGAWRKGRGGARLWPLGFLPIVVAMSLPAPRVHVFETKHVFFAVPFLLLAVAANAHGARRRTVLDVALLAVLLAMNVWGAARYHSPAFEKEPWRHVVADIESRAEPGDLALFSPEYALAPYLVYGGQRVAAADVRRFLAEEGRVPGVERVWTVELESPVANPLIELSETEATLPPDVPRRSPPPTVEVPAAVNLMEAWRQAGEAEVHRGYLGGIRVTLFARERRQPAETGAAREPPAANSP